MRAPAFLISIAMVALSAMAAEPTRPAQCPVAADDIFTKSFAASFVTLEEIVDEKIAEERDGKVPDDRLYLPPYLRFATGSDDKLDVQVSRVPFDGKPHEVSVHLMDSPAPVREAIAARVREYAKGRGGKVLSAFAVSRLLTPVVHSVRIETLEGGVKFDGVELRPDGNEGFGVYLRAELATKADADALVARLQGPEPVTIRVSFQMETSHGDKSVIQTIRKHDLWTAACRPQPAPAAAPAPAPEALGSRVPNRGKLEARR